MALNSDRFFGVMQRIKNGHFKEIGREGGVDWIHLSKDQGQWKALVNTAVNSQDT